MRAVVVFERFAAMLDSLADKLASLFVPIMFTSIFVEVLARVLNYPLFWIEELARYLMIFMAFVAAAPALTRGTHPRVTFLLERLSSKLRRKIEIASSLVILLFCGLLAVEGTKQALQGLSMRTATLGIYNFWPYLAVPTGAVFLFVSVLSFLINSQSRQQSLLQDKHLSGLN